MPSAPACIKINSKRLEIVEIGTQDFYRFFKSDFLELELREKYFLGFDVPNYSLHLPENEQIQSFFARLSTCVIGGLQVQEDTLSFFIRHDFAMLGLATEMVTATTDYLLTLCHTPRIWARALRSNNASRRVLVKSGFSEVGLEYRTLKNGFRAPIVLHTKILRV